MGSEAPVTVPEELLPVDAKGLVFDCDGTLVDSMRYHYEAWKNTCNHYGLPLTAALMVELAGKPVHELFDIITARAGKAGKVDREAFFRLKNEYYANNPCPITLIHPVMDIVYAGHARGLPMAVASGGTRHHVMKGLTETGIVHLFDAIVCGEDVAHGKPAPDAFLLAASKIGIDPAHCVGYEDAKLGMEAIHAAKFMAAVDVTVLPGYPLLTD